MENYNRIDLTIIPVEGVDLAISCAKCPSACCRKGMTLPLSAPEAEQLVAAGTELRPVQLTRLERWRRGLGKQSFYELQSDCGNLVIGEAGTTSCGVFNSESPERPRVCGEFVMGGYACASVQAQRQMNGEDEFVAE